MRKSLHMELDDVFFELEQRFASMLSQRQKFEAATALEVQLAKDAPHEIGGAGQRILLISPQLGSDFVAGVDQNTGDWWAIRLAAVRSIRSVAFASNSATAVLGRSETTLAELASEWFTPIRLRLFLSGETQAVQAHVTSVDSNCLGIGSSDGELRIPLASLIAIRAKFAELATP